MPDLRGPIELRNKISLIGIMFFLFFRTTRAQELEARSYSVVPVGMHTAALSYTYSKGNVISDMVSPIQDLNVTTSAINMGYVQTFSLFNKLSRIQVAVPYGFLNG